MPLLEIIDLSYDYTPRSGTVHALKKINACFDAGRVYAVTGRSGSGKTTLLSLIAALDRPMSGQILLDGKSIFDERPDRYRRENISMVFQSYNLIAHLTAGENVELAFELNGTPCGKRAAVAREILRSVGLGDEYYRKRPHQMSGGEQQRVAIARAVASGAKIILADEPTGNLDNQNSEMIISQLTRLAHEEGRCVIIVTHSEEIAAGADVRYHMSDGVLSVVPISQTL